MMKLFLLYIGIFFTGLLMISGEEQRIAPEDVCVEVVNQDEQLASEFSVNVADANWLKKYFLMLKVINRAKQLDLPVDYEKCWNLPCKMLPWAQQSASGASLKVHYFSKYLRMLSERHSDGFYLYFLRKLLI